MADRHKAALVFIASLTITLSIMTFVPTSESGVYTVSIDERPYGSLPDNATSIKHSTLPDAGQSAFTDSLDTGQNSTFSVLLGNTRFTDVSYIEYRDLYYKTSFEYEVDKTYPLPVRATLGITLALFSFSTFPVIVWLPSYYRDLKRFISE